MIKRPLFAQRSDDSRSRSPTDASSPDQRHPQAPSSPHANSGISKDSDTGLREGDFPSGSVAQKEVRGTPGPIRVDEGSVACVIEQHLPSSSDQADIRPSDTRLDTTLVRSSLLVDPQVLEFCAWLERTASLGSASPTAPHVAPFHRPPSQNESRQLQETQEEKCRTSAYPESGELPPWPNTAKTSTLRPALTSSARDAPVAAPFRRYECENYQVCLDVAAALDWENFTCSSCNGQVDRRLLWRAKHAQRRDPFAQECCQLPDMNNDQASVVPGPPSRGARPKVFTRRRNQGRTSR